MEKLNSMLGVCNSTEDMFEILNAIRDNISKIIIGKTKTIDLIMAALLCEGHVLIEDVPGVGKTLLVSTLAKTLNGIFNRIQFTPDVMPSDIMGFSMFNPSTRQFEYRKGAAMCNFLLADEINRTSPKTQSSLLEIMEEYQVTVDGETFLLPRPFMVLATQNPIECFGTYPLPEAQMDRFFIRINIGYPEKNEELMIIDKFGSENPLNTLTKVADTDDVIMLQNYVKTIKVDECIKEYIVEIVEETRKRTDLVLGVSPRGTLSLYKASKAWAFIQGRDFVIPDDVQEMAIYVLSHRLILSSGTKSKNLTDAEIVKDILTKVRVPSFV